MTAPATASATASPRLTTAALAALGALALAVAAAWWASLGWILDGWRENPYFSHGPLVPLITAGLLYRQRGALLTTPWRTCWPGLGLTAVAVAIGLAGRALDINVLVAGALVIALHGIMLSLAGGAVYRLCFFPLAFLAFAVPFSWLLIHEHSFPLQMLSAKLASGLMNVLTGAQSVALGSRMQLDGQDYVVGVQCSGFKAVIGLTMIGLLTAYLTDTTPGRKVLLAILAEPVAVIANVIRLTMILVVGRLVNHEFAVGWFHDFSGLLMLGIAIGLLLAVARLVVGPGAEIAAAEPTATDGVARWSLATGPLLANAVLIGVLAGLGPVLAPAQPPAPTVDLAALPMTLGPWQGEPVEIDSRVREELGEVEIVQRLYRPADGEGPTLQLIVICGMGRRSLHSPAACYRGAGNEVLGQDDAEVLLPGGETLRCRRLIIGVQGRPTMMALYTYYNGTETTTDWTRHQAESTADRQVIWTQLHFAAPWQGTVTGTTAALQPFVEVAWPEVKAVLPD